MYYLARSTSICQIIFLFVIRVHLKQGSPLSNSSAHLNQIFRIFQPPFCRITDYTWAFAWKPTCTFLHFHVESVRSPNKNYTQGSPPLEIPASILNFPITNQPSAFSIRKIRNWAVYLGFCAQLYPYESRSPTQLTFSRVFFETFSNSSIQPFYR